MTIKEARQSGSMVSIKWENTTKQVQGILIGYTQKAVFIKYGRNLNVFVEKNGNVVSSGYNIVVNTNEEVKMYGNCAGIQNGSNVRLYDETGRPAGTKRV